MKLLLSRFLKFILVALSGTVLTACGGGSAESTDVTSLSAPTAHALSVGTVSSPGTLVTVASMTLKSSARVNRTVWQYVYQVNVTNSGGPISNAVLKLQNVGIGTSIMSGQVNTGTIAAGATVAAGTIAVQQDRTYAFSTDGWIWSASVTVATSSASPSAAGPVIGIGGYASLDFTGSPNLLGTPVTLAKIVDPVTNEIATNDSSFLQATFPDSSALKITLTTRPGAGGIALTLFTGSTYSNLTTGQSPVVYHIITADTDAGDGGSGMIPLSSTIDLATGNVTATLPASAFETSDNVTWIAAVKIGASITSGATAGAPTSTIQSVRPQPTNVKNATIQRAPGSGGISIPCPFNAPGTNANNCVERSMFNTYRRTAKSTTAKWHRGIDLVAASGTDIYAPPGALTIGGYSPYQHCIKVYGGIPGVTCNNAGQPSPATVAPVDLERESGGHCGIFIVVSLPNPPGWQIKYCHLSSISSDLIGANGLILTNKPITGSLGKTGQTGAAIVGGPHLHMEVDAPDVKYSCQTNSMGVQTCRYFPMPVDPFTLMIKSFTVDPPTPVTLTVGQTASIHVNAKDTYGASILSDVEKAVEYLGPGPTDPTRKLCLTPSSPGFIYLNLGGIGILAGPRGSSCVPWTSTALTLTDGTALPPGGLTETIEYSTDPEVQISSDRLSKNAALNGDFASISINASSIPSSVSVSATPNPGFLGQEIILSARITPVDQSIPVTAVPTGSVTFLESGSALCTGSVTPTGEASCQSSFQDIGNHAITAQYSGDAIYPPTAGTTTVLVEEYVIALAAGEGGCQARSLSVDGYTQCVSSKVPICHGNCGQALDWKVTWEAEERLTYAGCRFPEQDGSSAVPHQGAGTFAPGLGPAGLVNAFWALPQGYVISGQWIHATEARALLLSPQCRSISFVWSASYSITNLRSGRSHVIAGFPDEPMP